MTRRVAVPKDQGRGFGLAATAPTMVALTPEDPRKGGTRGVQGSPHDLPKVARASGGSMQNRLLRGTAGLGGVVLLLAGVLAGPAAAQPGGPSGPPAVGVVAAAHRPVTESSEFIGRVQAVDRVALVARVAAFLEEQRFTEGAEVKAGDLLYTLERGPYEADLAVRQAAVAQAEAELANARAALARARDLRSTGTGTQVTLDNALAQERSAAARLLAAQAQVRHSRINLDYTEIRAPIDGRIGRTAVTVGNVVGPNSGVLAAIVSQDPMYVTFPMLVRPSIRLD
jgi:membrane fusion protein (multidrug efflux system)